MSLTNEAREALDRLHLTGWHLVAEHDPGCPGDERYCRSHCPVPVQHPATDDEINAAVEQIVARHVAEARAAALNEAADAVLTEFDPPIDACIWASEWLRDRATSPP